ncbi:integrase [Lysobacter sp. K5869]|nr:integrase [Lysobacter sp. K5869]
MQGSIAFVMDRFHDSYEFKQLSPKTREHYGDYLKAIKVYRVKNGAQLGDLLIDKLTPGGVRKVIHAIALGRPAEKPGEEAVPGYPTKANHWLRYLRRVAGWGYENDECKTNPFKGVSEVQERANNRMPDLLLFRAVQDFVRARGQLGGRKKGALPPYTWAAMELAYQARLRGIEVLTMNDAHVEAERLRTNRRKGSRDNLTRIGERMAEALEVLLARRAAIWAKKRMPTPLRPEDRTILVSERGTPLTSSGWHSMWQRLMREAIKAGVLKPEQRFALHGLKHRGITDSKGDKRAESGLTEAMVRHYDHDVPEVEPAADPAVKHQAES